MRTVQRSWNIRPTAFRASMTIEYMPDARTGTSTVTGPRRKVK